MAARGATPVRLFAFFAIVAGLAAATAWGLQEGHVPSMPFTRGVAELAPVFAAAAVASLGLAAAFRVPRLVLRREGAMDAMRTLERAAGVVVVLFVLIVILADFGTALVSVGLIGFGLTLALQRPILAVAGWATIRFGRLFRIGDRIEIQGIVGDVLEIGLFKTRVWEIGSTASPLPWGGAVSPLRDTARVVTISNATFLEHPVANATSDVPYVFDEFSVGVAYEADWRFGESQLRRLAEQVLDPGWHHRAAEEYVRLMRGRPTHAKFPDAPVILCLLRDSWIELRLRYLVHVHDRSRVRDQLSRRWQEAAEANPDRLPNVYPRSQPMPIGADGRPRP